MLKKIENNIEKYKNNLEKLNEIKKKIKKNIRSVEGKDRTQYSFIISKINKYLSKKPKNNNFQIPILEKKLNLLK